MKATVSVLCALLVGGCAAAAPTSTASPAPTSTPRPSATAVPTIPTVPPGPTSTATAGATIASRVEGWRIDLDVLVERIEQRHPKLETLVSIADMEAAADALAAQIETLTDDELMAGVLRIVAMPSAGGCDAHMGAFIWGDGVYPVDILPLRLWLFHDGVHIVDALPPYESLIGGRIEEVEGRPTADVLAAVDPIIPRDNDQTVRLLVPRFVLIPQILRGLGLADDGPVELTIRLADDLVATTEVASIARDDYNTWAGSYGLHLPVDEDVLYLSRISHPLWWERLEDGTLFVQYNRVTYTRPEVLDQLRAELVDPQTDRVVLDIRHNYGGEVSALDPMLKLFIDPRVDRTGKFFVVTGRNTFSAGSLFTARLDAQTSAQIVGEPMGGCPTAWGNSRPFRLPFSGIEISVPGTFEVGVSPDDERQTIEPDIAAPLTFEDWQAGNDPAMSAIEALER